MGNDLYTKDPVAQAVEDYTLGKMGSFSGNSVAESIGYAQQPAAPKPAAPIIKDSSPDQFLGYASGIANPEAVKIVTNDSQASKYVDHREITWFSWSLLFLMFLFFSGMPGAALIDGQSLGVVGFTFLTAFVIALIPCMLKKKSWKICLLSNICGFHYHKFPFNWLLSLDKYPRTRSIFFDSQIV